MSRPPHVLITGASSGLGAALARHYAGEGCRLSLFGRDRARLEDTAAGCRGRAAAVDLFVCDLRDSEATARALEAADAQAPVDLLFANAGVGGAGALGGPAGEALVQAHAVFETNVLGVINTVVPLLPNLVARRRGHIVLMGSIAGLMGLPQSPAYSASKAAVHTYGEGLRRLLRRSGVSVTVVCPGFVETPMSASLPMERPFLWSADRAAAEVARAVARKRRRAIFPWQLAWVAEAARHLPAALVDRLIPQPERRARL
jgi:short-subunit dehydrogenase